MFSRTSNASASKEDAARGSASQKLHTDSNNDPPALVVLQHSLSSMDLNVSTSQSSSSSSSSMVHNGGSDTVDGMPMVSAPIVPLHRRTTRQRTAERQPVTNRRSICRPRKLAAASSQIFTYVDNQTVVPTMLAVAMIATAEALSRPTMSESELTSQVVEKEGPDVAAAAVAARQREPTAKQIARFYMQANKSAGRVKSTCLETIDECSGEDDESSAADAGILGDHCNFLYGRKLKRSLSFAAAAVHHQRRAVSKQLVQRRKRRIQAKLGAGTRKPAKFSMQVFLEKMRVLHEADEGTESPCGQEASTEKGAGGKVDDDDHSGMDASGPTEMAMEAMDGV